MVEFFQRLCGSDLPALEALPEVVYGVFVITHTLPESLNIRQDVRVRTDCFEAACDVIENVQVFEDRADLVAPHIAPAGRDGTSRAPP